MFWMIYSSSFFLMLTMCISIMKIEELISRRKY